MRTRSAAATAGPPQTNRPLLTRRRLLAALAGRFERRLTTLVAGPGFGKTTLLVQALDQNAHDPRGIDLWLGCRPEHGSPAQLLRALARLTQTRSGSGHNTSAIAEAIWQRSPEPIALILDDAHALGADSDSWTAIESLLHELPTNGHLVLASRREPPIAVTRWLAQGQATELSEADLRFDPIECEAFAAKRGVDPGALSEADGWPAVLELIASVGSARVPGFLWEEILGRIAPERRSALARLAFLDAVDDELAQALVGVDSVRTLFANLPLTYFDERGRAHMHALFREELARDPEAQDPGMIREAARMLQRRAEVARAIELALDLDDDHTTLAEILDAIAKERSSLIERDVLDSVLHRLPEDVLASPAGQLLQGAHYLAADATRAAPHLEKARTGFIDRRDEEGEYAALGEQLRLAYWENDHAATETILDRVEQLGPRLGSSYVKTQWPRAQRALINQQPYEVLRVLDEVDPDDSENAAHFAILGMISSLDIGDLDRFEAEVARVPTDLHPRLAAPIAGLRFEAAWLRDGADPSSFENAKRLLMVHGMNQNLAQFQATMALAGASIGRLDDAGELAALAAKTVERATGSRPRISLRISQAALRLAAGDEVGAAETLRRCVRDDPFGAFPLRPHLRGLALYALLCPELRPDIDALRLGPVFDTQRKVGHALVSLREEGDLARAADLDWEHPATLGAMLPPALFQELAVAAAAAGAESAEEALMRGAQDPRPALRTLTEHAQKDVARTSGRLLASFPIRPDFSLEICALGPLEVRRDGEALTDEILRRERVRELLQFLVVHRRTDRDAVAAALWPEQSEASAKNNLRVNITHLQKVLEPARQGREPAWFLRVEGESLCLQGGDQLSIDAARFDALCDEALQAEEDRLPAVVLECYREATSLYRGDYLAELFEADWAEFERVRLRSRFVHAAVRAGELTLAKGDTQPTLELARRALQFDDLCEPAHRLVALAYRDAGDRAAAHRTLKAAMEELTNEGLSPARETLQLLESLAQA